MNKTQKILACVDNVKYESIKNVVGCSEQMVYVVLKNEKSKYAKYTKPLHKGFIPKKHKYKELVFSVDQSVTIKGSPEVWNIYFVGREVLGLRKGSDIKSVAKNKISKIV